MSNKNNQIKDFEIYLRLAHEAHTKQERDYYVTCAKLALRRVGYDVSGISENPLLALEELDEILLRDICGVDDLPFSALSEKVSVPYTDLFEEIEGL